jgi:hypothetical protein
MIFIKETSLHGWKYLGPETRSEFKLVWAFVLAAALVSSIYFMFYYSSQFLAATTVTSIHSTMAPIKVKNLKAKLI